MKIQVWVDYSCPYCYIGKKIFETARAALPGRDFDLELMSFQLNPNLMYQGDTVLQYLAKTYKLSMEEARAKNLHSEKFAAHVGLEINNETAKMTNTRDAHRVFQMAKRLGKSLDFGQAKGQGLTQGQDFGLNFGFGDGFYFSFGAFVFDRIQRAYFAEGALISDHETLATLAADCGMERAAVLEMLRTEQFHAEVQKEHDLAVEKQIQYVPHFVLPSGDFIEGVLSVRRLTEWLEQA